MRKLQFVLGVGNVTFNIHNIARGYKQQNAATILRRQMEADWTEITRISLQDSTAANYSATTITAFAFDPTQDLLWIGNEQGKITSFYGPELQRYTSYKAHQNRDTRVTNAPVRQLLFCDAGVLSVSDQDVHLCHRRGITAWHATLPDMENLRCMSFTGRGNAEIVVAGCQKTLYRIDVEKGAVTETLSPTNSIAYTTMRRSGQWICAASHDGSIHILDSKSFVILNTWKAYAGNVNDLDARGDYLLTCGWATRHYQGLSLEQLVRVYDLKLEKPAPPISFPPGAAYVRMHPKLMSTCMVISQTGAIYSIDVQNPDVPMMRFISTYDAQLRGLEMMPSGNGFAMLDSNNQIILWGSPTKTHFVEYAQPTEFPDVVPPAQHLDWSIDTPLSTIGMPYYRESLLSVWSNSMVHEVGALPSKLEPAVQKFQSGVVNGDVGVFSRATRRNEVQNSRPSLKGRGTLATPRFLSERTREMNDELPRRLSEDVAKSLAELTVHGGSLSIVPALYQVVEIKYSKFGVDDFDFGYYNATQHSGLETHIINSYANALLQLFHSTPVIRNTAMHHTARDCTLEMCLLCELGFLFDMLEKAKGKPCQATNLLKTLSKHPDAASLGVLEEHTTNLSLNVMVQNLTRFLFASIKESSRQVPDFEPPIQQAFGTTGLAFSRCGHCAYEASQPKVWYAHELIYPAKPYKASPRQVQQRFSHILKASVERYNQQRGWCSNCQGYKPITSKRLIQAVPAVLTLNAAIHSQEGRQLWTTPDFLPAEIGIIVKDGQFFCYEGQDLKSHQQRRAFDIVVYELVGFVADVTLSESQKSHMVSLIDTRIVAEDGGWHLFNDFLVKGTSKEDALHFDQRWKLPSVLMYQVKGAQHYDDSWKAQIDTRVVFRSVVQPKFTLEEQFLPLQQLEPLPGLSTHCAIDAEFVRLLREEIDVGADGTRTITRPHRSGLARVSVLRGDEPRQGVPFIDDYIAIEEPIDDYLTEFSGLKPGDLTLGTSQYNLVSLKAVYKKLWVLLNLGVQFIGHGLKSDFRIINMHVPENQVIDTQELFSLGSRARRKLSLRFLAWLLLKEDIQQNSEEGHDSIEDAQTALKLWRKYLEYVDAGILESMIDEIYLKGKVCDFKVPAERDRSVRNSGSVSGSAPGTPMRSAVSLAKLASPLR